MTNGPEQEVIPQDHTLREHRLNRVRQVLALCMATGACAPASQPAGQSREVGVSVRATTYQTSSEKEALRSFKPVKEAVLSGGECSHDILPGDPGRRLTAHFPNRSEAETQLILIVAPSGAPLRYMEVRGVPRPRYIWEVEEHLARTESTHIQLDYITDTAFAGNRKATEPGLGVHGTIQDFIDAGIIDDLSRRQDLVKEICATG